MEGALSADSDALELYDWAPVGYFVLEADSTIRQTNLAGAQLLGWPRDWLAGKPLTRWVVREDRCALLDHVGGAANRAETAARELRLRTRGGRRMEVRLCSNGRDGRCRSVMLDVSQWKHAERESRALQERLNHLTRVGTMGHLVSSLAHDLNQPLGTIVLNCDTALRALRAHAGVSPGILEALAQAAAAAGYAGETVRQLRRHVRGDGADRAPVELAPLVRRTLRLVEAEARDTQAEIDLAIPEELPRVTAAPVEIEQVLVNLLLNSLQAMQRAGTPSRRIALSVSQEDALVQVSVRDSGPGMDARTVARAFLPLKCSEEREWSEGLGMGLPMSRSIIEAHGGRLWIEPDAGSGAVLHFTLPIAA